MEKIKKITLSEKEMPTQWYNITADLPNAPLPMLNPKTKQPATPEDLLPIFAEELVKQEFSTSPFIDIPEEVQDLYRLWRPTPPRPRIRLGKSVGHARSHLFQK